MLQFLVRRLIVAVLVAATVMTLAFVLTRLSGDLAISIAGPNATQADVEAVRKAYGLDRPLVAQFFTWVGNALTGDLGDSYFFKTRVSSLIAERMPITLTLGLTGLVIALLVSLPLGILGAVRENTATDRAVQLVALLGQAMPSFWLGLILMIVFGLELGWLPISGTDSWDSYIMPGVVLAFSAIPALTRLTRAGMIQAMGSDYIRTARAKGLSRASILLKHALRNAAIPVVAIAAVQLGFMLGGSIVIEQVFALHGVGFLAWESIGNVTTGPKRGWRSVSTWIGAVIVGIAAICAVFAPLLVPHDPFAQDLGKRLLVPFWMEGSNSDYILGTDQLGRDYLSRLIWGCRISMLIGVTVTIVSALIGITIGVLGGFLGGRVDDAVLFAITTRLSIPVVLVALAVVGLLGSSMTLLVITLGLLLWDRFAVVARSTTMQVRNLDFVAAAWCAGCSRFRILSREVLPNIASHLVVVATLEIALAILLEAALSFLGLGVPPPLPSWGLMIAEAKDYMFFSPWVIVIPGVALFVLVLGINLLGDGLRDLFGARTDP